MQKIKEWPCYDINTKFHNENKRVLAREWSEWIQQLQFHWSWYGHFTFKDYPHQEQGSKCWDIFIHKLNRRSFGCNYYKNKSKGVTWVRASEYQARGSLHYHALIGNIPGKINRFDFMRIWEGLAGFCRIYFYRLNGGAEDYLTKSAYAFKQGEVDVADTLKYHIDDLVIEQLRKA